MTKKEARAKAISQGASPEEIDRQALNYLRQLGTVPFNNMIRALQMHPWNNTVDDWTRLAAALTARSMRR